MAYRFTDCIHLEIAFSILVTLLISSWSVPSVANPMTKEITPARPWTLLIAGRMDEAFDELDWETGKDPEAGGAWTPAKPFEKSLKPAPSSRKPPAAPASPAGTFKPVAPIRPSLIPNLPQLWSPPRISACPASAEVGATIRIEGTGLGDPGQPDKTDVIFPINLNQNQMLHGKIVTISNGRSGSFRGLEVEVPRGALKSWIIVRTPGGESRCPNSFDPIYTMHLSPQILSPGGDLSFLAFYDSRMSLADGENNSLFALSDPLREALNLPDFVLTFPRQEQKVDLLVGKTTVRVRIPGNQLGFDHRDTIIRSNAPDVRFEGNTIVIHIDFESEGAEFIGEYETQNPLNGEIGWVHFMNINVDNLAVEARIPLKAVSPEYNGAYHRYHIEVKNLVLSVEFDAAFDIFEVVQFNLNQPEISELAKDAVVDTARAYLSASGFSERFAEFFTGYVKTYFINDPIRRIELNTATDGGLDIKAFNRVD
jgi:hypothetical protein